MRIHRRSPLYTYRRHRQRSGGCLPLTLFSSLLVVVVALSWGWISQRLLSNPAPTSRDLTAARQAFDRGELDATITAARQIYESNPDRTDALWLLTRALVYRSYTDYNTAVHREIALQLTTAAFRRTPNDAETLAIHAFALQANGQPVEAFKIAERALNRDAENMLARLATGFSYGGVGGYDQAMREHETTLRMLLPDDALRLDTLRALAISYSDLGRYEEAGKTVEQALMLNPKLPVLYFEKALYALQLGDTSEATEAYFEILAQDSQNVKARLRMCEVASMMRDRDTALKYCNEVTRLAPTWSEGWYRLGREFFLQGDFPAAQGALNRCSSLQIMQNVPVGERRFECWYLQGQAAEINGDCPSLIATYNEFRAMSAEYAVPQTWVYPPEGPPLCAES
jgi:tetratricopeptide (TPR) repeat protein